MSITSSSPSVSASPDMRHLTGPFDIVGDVHGCASELEALLGKLGYEVEPASARAPCRVRAQAARGRLAVFVGDLVDRGPNAPQVLRIVMAMVESGLAIAVPGNHDAKFLRWIDGRQVKVTHGLDRTIAQHAGESPEFMAKVRAFFASLPIHAWLDGGRLAVAHAGIKEHMLGKTTGDARSFCLFGDTSGETDEAGLPVRYHWAAEYRGTTAIVYGHTPVPEAEWFNNTICVDTGCCFGGRLSALRWPEREIVSVPAAETYMVSGRPFGHPPARPGLAHGPE